MTNDPGPLCLGMALSVYFSIFTFYLPALMFSLYQCYKLKILYFQRASNFVFQLEKKKTEHLSSQRWHEKASDITTIDHKHNQTGKTHEHIIS